MGYPEIILLAWYAIALIQTLLKHGTPARLGLTTVIGTIGVPILLAWGGFFSTVGWPQVIWVFMYVFLGGAAYLNREEYSKGEHAHNFYVAVPTLALIIGLYWWGGFFA